jgi:nucleotide-binding universal stress UspA family protein
MAKQAATPPIDLVILASHGYTGVKHWLPGSVAERLVRSAPVSVLVFHDQKPLHIHRHMDGTSSVRALVPLDTSARSLAAVLPAARMVSALSTPDRGELHLAHIVVDSAAESMPELETRLQTARQKLGAIGLDMRERLRASSDFDLASLTLTWAVTLELRIAEGIVRRAEHGEKHAEEKTAPKCDLIVMTTHGFGNQQQWAEGRITEQVLHATHLPVLVVRLAEGRVETDAQMASPATRAR